jgi:hypothetical protein
MPELQTRGIKRPDQDNLDTRAATERTVINLATTTIQAGANVVFPKSSNNALLLLAGDHNGCAVSSAGSQIRGVSGARIVRLWRISADCIVDGVAFESVGNDNATTLVSITNNAKVMFRNCSFRKATGDEGDYVTLESGSKAVFVGCYWDGTPNAGNRVNNAGVAANVQLIGVNKTGRPDVNVTIVAEV